MDDGAAELEHPSFMRERLCQIVFDRTSMEMKDCRKGQFLEALMQAGFDNPDRLILLYDRLAQSSPEMETNFCEKYRCLEALREWRSVKMNNEKMEASLNETKRLDVQIMAELATIDADHNDTFEIIREIEADVSAVKRKTQKIRKLF